MLLILTLSSPFPLHGIQRGSRARQCRPKTSLENGALNTTNRQITEKGPERRGRYYRQEVLRATVLSSTRSTYLFLLPPFTLLPREAAFSLSPITCLSPTRKLPSLDPESKSPLLNYPSPLIHCHLGPLPPYHPPFASRGPCVEAERK